MPNIMNVMDLATCHLTEQTGMRLSDCESAGVTYYPTDFGWLVHVADPEAIDTENLPADLAPLLDYARAHGCRYILFDADGPIDPAFQTFDW